MNRILVVIPYLASAAQGNELRLAVSGWWKHFKEPHQIVIVGDCPDWLKGYKEFQYNGMNVGFFVDPEWDFDIKFIECPRINPVSGQYLPHLDMVHKFREVRKHFPDSKGFIYTCDDIYATADFTMDEILTPKHPEIGPYIKFGEKESSVADWWNDRIKTAELCCKEGIPARDWVCHLPVYYDWDKLFAIYDRYDCDHVSYIVENIYFGLEYGAMLSYPAKEFRDEVKSSNPSGIRPVGSVKWITNQNSGWSERLENILRQHYGKE